MTHQMNPNDAPGRDENLNPHGTATAGLTNAGELDRVGEVGIPPLTGPGSVQAAANAGAPGFPGGPGATGLNNNEQLMGGLGENARENPHNPTNEIG